MHFHKVIYWYKANYSTSYKHTVQVSGYMNENDVWYRFHPQIQKNQHDGNKKWVAFFQRVLDGEVLMNEIY